MRALTLIEVLAALVLLATLLGGLLAAKQRARRQLAHADRKLAAIAAADALLATWVTPSPDAAERSDVPWQGSGTLGGIRDLHWTTRAYDTEQATTLQCRVVRFTVTDTSLERDRVLFTLDLLSPLHSATPAEDALAQPEANCPSSPRLTPGEERSL